MGGRHLSPTTDNVRWHWLRDALAHGKMGMEIGMVIRRACDVVNDTARYIAIVGKVAGVAI